MDKISYSRVGKYDMCPYAHHLAYNEKIQKYTKARPLIMGSLIHKLLELRDLGQDWLAYLNQVNDDLTEEEKDAIGSDSVLFLEDTIRAYEDALPDDYGIQETEYELRAKINGMEFIGYVDGIALVDDGLWIVERKTSGSTFPEEFNLRLREQPYIYQYLLEKIFKKKFKGVIWEFITSNPLKEVALNKDGSVSKRSHNITPHMWRKGTTEPLPETLSYANVVERFVIPTKRETLNLMVSNFFKRAKLADVASTIRKYDPMTCTRFCDYATYCDYELRGLDTNDLIGTAYKKGKDDTVENTKD